MYSETLPANAARNQDTPFVTGVNDSYTKVIR